MSDMTTDESEKGTREATAGAVPAAAHDADDFAFRWAYGNPEAPFTIVEFGDFECPYCGAAKPVLHELINGSNSGKWRQTRRTWPSEPLMSSCSTGLAAPQ